MNDLFFSLRRIASWTSGKTEVILPALQRGLVWKPNQVELLWDSILRGFPIGSFMLSEIVEVGQKGKYYLMDGQQRYNAISLGYNTVPKAKAVLWMDLEPPTVKNSTRLFWIKTTTQPHPWGFKNDDDCSRLNTAEKRQALNQFNLQGSIYNKEFSLKSTWPVEANCPIPLWCLLEASSSTEEASTFLQESLGLFWATDFAYRERFKLSDKAKAYMTEVVFPALKALDNYHINCNLLPQKVLESETLAEVAEQTALEVLFTRLNTGGTRISRDDLNYSAIKAYWPSIKDVNDDLAEKYMNPSELVMLAFRLALTDDNDKCLRNEFSIRQIRSIARDDDERKKIESFYNTHLLERILFKIDKWLGVTGDEVMRTPSILRTVIARNSPDVYLLLMYFAYKDLQSSIDLNPSGIKALAFYLHWFTSDNDKRFCVQEIFSRCKKGINYENVLKGISCLMHKCKLLQVYKPEEVRGFVEIKQSHNWRVWNNIPAPARDFFNRVFWYRNSEPKEMLLFAEREYINTHFANYDPARQDMWAEYNRPWDFDHIVARNRIVGKWGGHREYDKVWLDSIGNIAAISFESNRSKNDGSDYSEYHANKDSLDYDASVESLKYDVTYYPEVSQQFAQITYNRFCKIYSKVYDAICVLFEQMVLPNNLQSRKGLFNKLIQKFPNAIVHFAASDENDYLVTREQDWTRQWMGVGIVKGDYMICFEWTAMFQEGKPQNAEIGIRKAPGTIVTKENMKLLTGEEVADDSLNHYWYICEDCNSIDLDYIIEKMDNYLSMIL